MAYPPSTADELTALVAATVQKITAPELRSATKFVTIAKSDATVLPTLTGLFVLTAGNLVVTGVDDVDSPAIPVTAGQTLPFAPKKVKAASTATVLGLAS
jgi:hypothetical protein